MKMKMTIMKISRIIQTKIIMTMNKIYWKNMRNLNIKVSLFNGLNLMYRSYS
jgi:hypothetical protein